MLELDEIGVLILPVAVPDLPGLRGNAPGDNTVGPQTQDKAIPRQSEFIELITSQNPIVNDSIYSRVLMASRARCAFAETKIVYRLLAPVP